MNQQIEKAGTGVEAIPYAEDPLYAEERKINHYDETRPLTNGNRKDTLTGEVIWPDNQR